MASSASVKVGDMITPSMQPIETSPKSIYRPLDPSLEEFRLLTLLPSRVRNAKLCCSLSHTSFLSISGTSASIQPYEALSYVWGLPDLSSGITLDNEDFLVTPNLAYILSNLRHTERPRVLWIDAICINQANLHERSQQIALMRKIYSHCQRDIAWLDVPFDANGQTSHELVPRKNREREEPEVSREELTRGLNVMKRISRESSTLWQLQEYLKHLVDGHSDEHDLSLNWFRSYEKTSLEHLIEKPVFWRRVWIIQELSCAPSVTIACAKGELEWELISSFLKDEPYFDAFHILTGGYRDSLRESKETWGDLFRRVKFVEDQRKVQRTLSAAQEYPGKQQSSLMDVLARFRQLEATDPRDKIYALLGLTNQDHGISIDYTKSMSYLYQKVTLTLIRLSGNLDIICQNPFEARNGPDILYQDRKMQEQTDGKMMPSWTADFSLTEPVPVLFAQRGIFNAGKANCNTPCHLLGQHKEILVLRGCVLGCVDGVRRRDRRQSPGEWSPSENMRRYLGDDALDEESRRMYSPRIGKGWQPSIPHEPIVQAFWRTMARDCTSPPKMRRLNACEIVALDSVNRDRLRNQESLKTFGLKSSRAKSAFTYDPFEGEDTTQLKDQSTEETCLTRLPYAERNYMFIMNSNGLFILTRCHVKDNDFIVILEGGKVPVILRKVEYGHRVGLGVRYHFVCVAYVHGFMDQEAEDAVESGGLDKEDFHLV